MAAAKIARRKTKSPVEPMGPGTTFPYWQPPPLGQVPGGMRPFQVWLHPAMPVKVFWLLESVRFGVKSEACHAASMA